MTHEEAANEARKDIKHVARKVVYHSEDIMKKMKKAKQKSFSKLFDYKSPRGNNWFYVLRIYGTSHRKLQFNAYFVCWHIAEKGIRALSIYNNGRDTNVVKIYTSHMFDRYKERSGLDTIDGKLDTIKTYMHRNGTPMVIEEDSPNDKINIICDNDDGMELGNMTRSSNIIVINTFITPDMMMGSQKIIRDIHNAIKMGDTDGLEKLKKLVENNDDINLID
jgi:hypothetical protein